MKNGFKNLKNGFKNLIIWFNIIWKDRWWDYTFLYKIIQFKLQLMENNFRKYGMHLDAEKDADNIKKCIFVLNRLLKDKYYENNIKNYDMLRKQDKEYLFNMLNKYIEYWWD